MRSLLLICVLLSSLAADTCLAQANSINILCSECRDPHDYPDDFANFAFNQIYGPEAWLSCDQADDFFVSNLDNQRVYVDVDFVFLGVGVEGFLLPYWPTNILKITLALPNGDLISAFRSVFQTSLPVPASTESNPYYDSAGGAHADDDDGYDEDEDDVDPDGGEYDWEETESDDYEGSTWIEDPDEDGNFEDADWCEEC